jgi:hypothetical protein
MRRSPSAVLRNQEFAGGDLVVLEGLNCAESANDASVQFFVDLREF